MKKKKALVIGGSKNDVIPMAVFVINLKKTNPGLVDEIVIFHDGIRKKDQTLINSIFPCRFEYYQFPGYDPKDFNDYVNKYFTAMVFCRYECLRLLSEYSVVIWSDYDVVILKDISELLEPCISGMKLLFSENSNSSIFSTFLSTIRDIDLSRYDLERKALSSAIIILFDCLNNSMSIYDWCIKITKKLGRYLYLTELSIYNLLLQEFKIDVSTIPSNIYALHPVHDEIIDDTKIIHAYGQPKFWNGLKNDIWNKNYQEWINLGGRKLSDRTLSGKIKKEIVKILCVVKKSMFSKNSQLGIDRSTRSNV
jgi:lipopolysaccharide biosynthesis glycosyltransferase